MDKHELILNNKHLVHIQAKKKKKRQPQLDFEELISIGYEALVDAADGYDEEKGDFEHFAAKCIANALLNYACSIARWGKISSSLETCDESVLRYNDDRKSDFEDMISVLKPEGRQLITWRVEGYTQKEIGERLGVSISKVSKMEEQYCNTLRSRWI